MRKKVIVEDKDISTILTFRYSLKQLFVYRHGYRLNFDTNENISYNVAKFVVERHLTDKIKHITSIYDKPAIMMSGGLDSVLLAAMLANESKNIHAYTARFIDDNEYSRAEEAAQQLDIPHTVVDVNEDDYMERGKYLHGLITTKLQPLHPNEIALTKLSEQARKDGCDVVVSGEGADDIFGGYDKLLTLNLKSEDKTAELLDFYRYFTLEERKDIIKKKWLCDDVEILKTFLVVGKNPDIRKDLFRFVQGIHTPGLLMRGRNAAIVQHMDIEFPYMEPDLATFVNSLPFEYKIDNGISKKLLRDIATNFIDKKFAYAKKHPFPVPFEAWLHELETYPLNKKLFTTIDISNFDGWHKWMLINLNEWFNESE